MARLPGEYKRVNLWLHAESYACVRDNLRALPGDETVSSLVVSWLAMMCPVTVGLREAVESGDRETIRALMEGMALDMFGQVGMGLHNLRAEFDAVGGEEDAT